MTGTDIAREIALLDLEQAVMASDPPKEMCDLLREAHRAAEQKPISAHLIDYGERVLVQISEANISFAIRQPTAMQLLSALQAALKVKGD